MPHEWFVTLVDAVWQKEIVYTSRSGPLITTAVGPLSALLNVAVRGRPVHEVDTDPPAVP